MPCNDLDETRTSRLNLETILNQLRISVCVVTFLYPIYYKHILGPNPLTCVEIHQALTFAYLASVERMAGTAQHISNLVSNKFFDACSSLAKVFSGIEFFRSVP